MHCCIQAAATGGAEHSLGCEMVSEKACPNHKVIAHDRAGEKRWCDFCGEDEHGNKVARGSGGWGTPSGRVR